MVKQAPVDKTVLFMIVFTLGKGQHVPHCILYTATLADNCSYRVQLTVNFPVGGHVNVLHDYKKT